MERREIAEVLVSTAALCLSVGFFGLLVSTVVLVARALYWAIPDVMTVAWIMSCVALALGALSLWVAFKVDE